MIRRIHFTAAALVAIAATAVPVSASAAGTLYMYGDPNYGLYLGQRSTTGWWNVGAGNNDRLSSAKNQTNWVAAFWYDKDREGHCWTQAPYTNDPSFYWWDDNKMSSYSLDRACPKA